MGQFHIKENIIKNKKIIDSFSLYQEFKEINKIDQETFWLMGFDCGGKPLIKECLFKGGLNKTIADSKIIFKRLLVKGCSGFSIIHNHLTNDCYPSVDDEEITWNLKEISKLLDITFFDHLIIGDNEYYSFKEEKIFKNYEKYDPSKFSVKWGNLKIS